MLVTHLPEVKNAFFHALADLPATWKQISKFAASEYKDFLEADSIQRSYKLGHLTTDLIVMFGGFGPMIEAGKIGTAFALGVEKGVLSASIQIAVETSVKTGGKIAAASGAVIIEASKVAPVVGKVLYEAAISGSFGTQILEGRVGGMVGIGEGLFKKLDVTSRLVNDLPTSGQYAIAVPKALADDLAKGVVRFKNAETFVTAWEDVAGMSRTELAKRLGLYSDKAGTVLKDTSDYSVLKFRFKDGLDILSCPLETVAGRCYGFIPGGRTSGGAREWLMNNQAIQDGLVEWIQKL
jgi:hypothetical protein